ncbi:hypothetical protein GOP47_0006396 [Adiantum capillus-veneris]|uniref:Uncharacterized protein n=1 Tax=Adiantum capillus-veneris TaxID=13818 RepID=A0A9D4V3C5_ADICA|nr:hypothetical protein GOP47_0006396 [Adiantum capillus-veneris]
MKRNATRCFASEFSFCISSSVLRSLQSRRVEDLLCKKGFSPISGLSGSPDESLIVNGRQYRMHQGVWTDSADEKNKKGILRFFSTKGRASEVQVVINRNFLGCPNLNKPDTDFSLEDQLLPFVRFTELGCQGSHAQGLTDNDIKTHIPHCSSEKVRWNTFRQGDIWINGLFPEDDSLTKNCNFNPISLQTSSDCYISEHSEVDWISKEIAYQELICNEKANYCTDAVSGKTEPIKEEHDMDIISTLAAVAALLRDWCALEAELSQPVVDEPIERNTGLENVYHDEWVWINDDKVEQRKMKKDVSMQLKGSHYNVAWDDFIQERLRRQQMLYHTYLQPRPASIELDCGNKLASDVLEDLFGSQKYVDIGWCSEERAEEEFYSFKPFLQPAGKTIEEHNACISNQSLEAGSTLNNSFAAQFFVDIDFSDQLAHQYASQHPVTSRYSFGRKGDPFFSPEVGDIFPAGHTSYSQVENDCIFGGGLILAEANKGGYVDDADAGKVLPGHILDDVKCSPSTIQDLGFTHGAFSNVDIKNETENDTNVVELVHEAMPFVLPYVCLQELLAMEEVCKSLRDWIRNDLLLWQQLHVEPPLSKNFTDNVFLELASRAKGQLRCLNLVDCTKVTEAAVEQVVFSNPRIAKLSLPGCSRISADSVVRMVEVLTHQGHPGLSSLKYLRVRNIYGLTREHLARLENMVGARSSYQRKPQYYHNGHHASICDDERPIDVEECPKCTNVRLPKCAACSRPGCGRHVDHFMRTPERTFFCGDCSGTSVDTRGPEFHPHS